MKIYKAKEFHTGDVFSSAWDNKESFLVLPNKYSGKESFISDFCDDLAEVYRINHFALLTSGSSGQPKIILAQKKRAEELTRIIHSKQNLERIQTAFIVLPLHYCYSFVNQLLWAKLFSRKVHISSGFSRMELLKEELKTSQESMICLVGNQVSLLIDYASGPFSGVKCVNFAGGPFPKMHFEKVKSIFPQAQIYNNYGCTEAMPRLTIRHCISAEGSESIGPPLLGVDLRTDKEGRLIFKSDYSAVALYENKEFKIFGNEWIPTGDIANSSRDQLWNIVGRSNEVFKRQGEKIGLNLILEEVKGSWKGEAAFYMEGESDHILLLSPLPTEQEYRAILKSLRSKFSRAHWPVRLESAKNLRYLENGKIDKIRLSSIEGKKVLWKQPTLE